MMPENGSSLHNQQTGFKQAAARFFWMFGGNFVLVISGLKLFSTSPVFFSIPNALYLVCIPLMIGVRYIDIVYYEGCNSLGEPSSLREWKRYAAKLITITATLWIIGWIYWELLA